MKFVYKPKNNLEKFGEKVYNLLVDNFPQTFFVGGLVRDRLIGKEITDIDIATSALPQQVSRKLRRAGMLVDDSYQNYGTTKAIQGELEVEITSFRKDTQSTHRYPKVKFIKSAKQDSQRRDFTINSLYLSPKYGKIIDFNNGLGDIKNRLIKFIGIADKRIEQDPLRIIRALRFALVLKFKLEPTTRNAIKNNFKFLKNLTKTKVQKEIDKIKNLKDKKILEKVINNPKLLDKYFK